MLDNNSQSQQAPRPTSLQEERKHFINSFRWPLLYVALLWCIKIYEVIGQHPLRSWGILPKHAKGLQGLLTYPLVHGDWEHLFSNSVPLIFLGFMLMHNFKSIAWRVVLFIYLFSGIFIWLLGRPNYHLGASGLVYGLAFFIFFSGVFRREIRTMALALVTVFFYGGLIWGMLPGLQGISWEGHIGGALAGFLMALYYRNNNLPANKHWQNEQLDDPENAVEEPFWLPPEPTKPLPDLKNQNPPSPPLKLIYHYKKKPTDNKN